MSSYEKRDKNEPSGVSETRTEKLEQFGEFLFQLRPIVEWLKLDEGLILDIFAGENELYFRIGSLQNSHPEEYDYYKTTYVVKELQKLYITQILQREKEVGLVVNHLEGDAVVSKNITISKTGEIKVENRTPELVSGDLGDIIDALDSLDTQILRDYPDYYDCYNQLADELEAFMEIKSDYETDLSDPTRDLVMNQHFQQHFEKMYGFYIKSGEIHWSSEKQFFIAFKIQGKLHFYCSPRVWKIESPKSKWISETTFVVRVTYHTNYEDYSKQKVKITLNESGIQVEEIRK